jgi:trypsin
VRKGHALRTQIGILVAFVALALGGGAQAIIGGSPDSTPYVGAYFQPVVQDGQAGFELCSGFMIGPTSFVTAAHCFDQTGGTPTVTFVSPASPASPGTTATFDAAHGDVAVFTLRDPQPSWAQLPGLDASVGATAIDIVGYGIQGFASPHKMPIEPGVRQIVTTQVKNAGSQADQFLKLLADPGGCFGDSGGPNFLSGTNTIVAITSGGSKNCNGVSYAERIDTPDMLTFLGQFANE